MENMLTFEIEADELDVFLQDVNEHLQAMETGILSMEQGVDQDTLNTTFRAAHTIKAVAATVGLCWPKSTSVLAPAKVEVESLVSEHIESGELVGTATQSSSYHPHSGNWRLIEEAFEVMRAGN